MDTVDGAMVDTVEDNDLALPKKPPLERPTNSCWKEALGAKGFRSMLKYSSWPSIYRLFTRDHTF